MSPQARLLSRQRLMTAIDRRFSASLNGGDPASVVELRLDEETALKLIDRFDALGAAAG